MKINSISESIKRYRLLNHWTQERLAEVLNLDTQYYAQLERGERNFSIDKIVTICNTFHLSISDIIQYQDNTREEDKKQFDELLKDLNGQLSKLSYKQLLVVLVFVNEIVPFIEK